MKHLIIFLMFFYSIFFPPVFAAENDLPLEKIKLPAGFKIELYARVPNAREMAFGDKGTLFVGSMQEGNVYAVPDQNQDGIPEKAVIVASGLYLPVGVAFHSGSLYISAVSRILRLDKIEENLENPPKPVIVRDDFPKDRHHGWKFIRFGPDEKLYVPVGAPCNVCEEKDPRYSAITRMNADGSDFEIFASGIRNTVGFDWHPETGETWFTDNGRDMLGDDLPPDELNRAGKAGLHFGFPYCHGKNIPDPKFYKKGNCADFVPPVQELGPHVASLGMRFYTGNMFPETYRNQIFIAEHGSWNRSRRLGYRVTLVRLNGNEAISYEPFASGWLNDDESVWGRPADVQVVKDGSLLVSDDHAGAIYRIFYSE